MSYIVYKENALEGTREVYGILEEDNVHDTLIELNHSAPSYIKYTYESVKDTLVRWIYTSSGSWETFCEDFSINPDNEEENRISEEEIKEWICKKNFTNCPYLL